MSYYRDTYLRSDDWRTLRQAKIHAVKEKCQLCGHKTHNPDVHHIIYRRLWDVLPADLRVMCRKCHDWVHQLLEKYPKLRTLPRTTIWKTVHDHYYRYKRYARPLNRQRDRLYQSFARSKKVLFASGLICWRRMLCADWIVTHPQIKPVLNDPEALLGAYISVVRDPRRLMPVLYNPETTGYFRTRKWRGLH